MSLIIPRSILPDDWMFGAYRRWRSLSCSLPERTSENPMIEFNGVRSSWLIVARKSLLSRFISKRARFACASSSTLRSRSPLTSRSSCCMATRLWSIRLKACDSSSNSSPVWIWLRMVSLPAAIASETSRRCLTGLTIT